LEGCTPPPSQLTSPVAVEGAAFVHGAAASGGFPMTRPERRRAPPHLAFVAPWKHIPRMTVTARRTVRSGRSANAERTVIYHGIKIAPISGKRSATAEAIRDALRARSEQARGALARD
jgi:hypothetical protein